MDPTHTVTAHRLGYLALLPFVLGAAAIWLLRDATQALAAGALSAYAAVVVSFLGGIHWGLGFRQPNAPSSLFVWGIVPSLVACTALLLASSAGLVLHAVMLVLCYLVDRKVYPAQSAAAWLPLRLRLTVVASLSCLLAAAGSLSLR